MQQIIYHPSNINNSQRITRFINMLYHDNPTSIKSFIGMSNSRKSILNTCIKSENKIFLKKATKKSRLTQLLNSSPNIIPESLVTPRRYLRIGLSKNINNKLIVLKGRLIILHKYKNGMIIKTQKSTVK